MAAFATLERSITISVSLLPRRDATDAADPDLPIAAGSGTGAPIILLRYAPLPSILRRVAFHYWLVRYDPQEDRWQRWEVWQTQNAGGVSWGHVHRDLMAPHHGVGGGPSRVVAEWRGNEADRISSVLNNLSGYPYRDRYWAWPGPNSNTFVAWVLHQAGIDFDLDPRGVGKDYLGTYGVGLQRTVGPGAQWETPLAGLKAHRRHGVELHLCGLTFGLSVWPFRLKTPFGVFPARGEKATGRRGASEQATG